MSQVQLTPEILDELKTRADLVGIIGKYIPLKPVGAKFMGICPFHQDSKPSLNVTPSLGIYKCFACGHGGDVIKFVQEYEKISFIEAVISVANQSNFFLPQKEETSAQKEHRKAITELSDINKMAQEYFHHLLLQNESGLEYFSKRGLTHDTIRTFKLGWAKESWDALIKHGMSKGVSKPSLLNAGLIVEDKAKGKTWDKFRGRIMFPIHNPSNKTIAFGGRSLDPNNNAKYMNSPETNLYKKSEVLYGLNLNQDSIRKSQQAIFVEGYMDLIQLFQAGIQNVVCVSGTALTPQHSQVLKRYTTNAVLVFDGDVAGLNAGHRSIPHLLTAGFRVSLVTLPDGEDPDSFVKTKGKTAFLQQVEDSSNIIEFTLQRLNITKASSPEDRASAISVIQEYLQLIAEPILRAEYYRLASQTLQIDEKLLRKGPSKPAKSFYHSKPVKQNHNEPMIEPYFEPMNEPFQNEQDYSNESDQSIPNYEANSTQMRNIGVPQHPYTASITHLNKNELHLVKLIITHKNIIEFAAQFLDLNVLTSDLLVELIDLAFIAFEKDGSLKLKKFFLTLSPPLQNIIEHLKVDEYLKDYDYSYDYFQVLLTLESQKISASYQSKVLKNPKTSEDILELQTLMILRQKMAALLKVAQGEDEDIEVIFTGYSGLINQNKNDPQ